MASSIPSMFVRTGRLCMKYALACSINAIRNTGIMNMSIMVTSRRLQARDRGRRRVSKQEVRTTEHTKTSAYRRCTTQRRFEQWQASTTVLLRVAGCSREKGSLKLHRHSQAG